MRRGAAAPGGQDVPARTDGAPRDATAEAAEIRGPGTRMGRRRETPWPLWRPRKARGTPPARPRPLTLSRKASPRGGAAPKGYRATRPALQWCAPCWRGGRSPHQHGQQGRTRSRDRTATALHRRGHGSRGEGGHGWVVAFLNCSSGAPKRVKRPVSRRRNEQTTRFLFLRAAPQP